MLFNKFVSSCMALMNHIFLLQNVSYVISRELLIMNFFLICLMLIVWFFILMLTGMGILKHTDLPLGLKTIFLIIPSLGPPNINTSCLSLVSKWSICNSKCFY